MEEFHYPYFIDFSRFINSRKLNIKIFFIHIRLFGHNDCIGISEILWIESKKFVIAVFCSFDNIINKRLKSVTRTHVKTPFRLKHAGTDKNCFIIFGTTIITIT